MSDVITDKKLKGKDLITIGIFSAIYFVINFAFMLLGGIHLFFGCLCLASLLCLQAFPLC